MVQLKTITCKVREACYDQGNWNISIKKTMPPASSGMENEGGERRENPTWFTWFGFFSHGTQITLTAQYHNKKALFSQSSK